MSVVDPTQESGNQAGPLVDIDDIQPDASLMADLRKTRITTPATRVLLVLIVLSVGFLGGALVDRWQRPSSSASGSVQSLINSFRRGGQGGAAAGGSGGAGGLFGGGAGGGGTVGTVKLVDGSNVYLTDTAGDVIKVTTTPSTQITISKTGTVSQLAPGSTIIVQGTASSDGTSMAATSISPSTGFGGRGLGGAAALTGG